MLHPDIDEATVLTLRRRALGLSRAQAAEILCVRLGQRVAGRDLERVEAGYKIAPPGWLDVLRDLDWWSTS